MLLRDLLAHPGLGLRLLHGSGAALDRRLRWVYTTDLIDPGRYLSGGELVITGLVWRNEPADSERFVATVAAAGAAALAAGDAVFHTIPDDVVAACTRHDLPLLAVPEETSFSAVTELVIGALTAARGDRLAHTLGRQRQLLSAVAGGLGLDELAAQVSAATGHVCRIYSATGRPVAAERLPDVDRDRLVAAFLTAARLPAAVAGHSVFAVGPASEQRLTSWFVAVEGEHTEWDADTADAVGELVAIAALDRARRDEGLRVARDIADDAVALIADGVSDHEASVRLRQAGLDPGAELTVVVATLTDGSADGRGPGGDLRTPAATRRSRGGAGDRRDPGRSGQTGAGRLPAGDRRGPGVAVAADGGSPGARARPGLTETARSLLADAAAHVAPPVVGVHERLAVAVLPADPAPLRAALGRIEPGLGGLQLAVGISRPAGPGALAGALREARHACDLAAGRPGALHVVEASEVTSHVALLAAVPDEVRRAFATRVLDPIVAYDARTDAGLLETLEAFLDCSGSWSRTAERLHLHVNTVRYRIGRVEDLTSRDLGTLADRVDVYLALRSR